MKKSAILIALAALVPLAGCVAPYPYYGAYYGPSYGHSYYDRGYYGGGGYGYQAHRSDPWADYNPAYDNE